MRCPYCGSPVIYRSADGIYHDNSKKQCSMCAATIRSVTLM
ncbi:MAG: zinc-finger-containing protein [Hydrogeniiclostridium mannosilyticum]